MNKHAFRSPHSDNVAVLRVWLFMARRLSVTCLPAGFHLLITAGKKYFYFLLSLVTVPHNQPSGSKEFVLQLNKNQEKLPKGPVGLWVPYIPTSKQYSFLSQFSPPTIHITTWPVILNCHNLESLPHPPLVLKQRHVANLFTHTLCASCFQGNNKPKSSALPAAVCLGWEEEKNQEYRKRNSSSASSKSTMKS